MSASAWPLYVSYYLTEYDLAAIEDTNDLVSWGTVCLDLQQL